MSFKKLLVFNEMDFGQTLANKSGMAIQLTVTDSEKRFLKPKKLHLDGESWTLGRGLQNQIIFLDQSLPERAGKVVIEKTGAIIWQPLSGETQDLLKNFVSVGSFQLQAEEKKSRKALRIGVCIVAMLTVWMNKGLLQNAIRGDRLSKNKILFTPLPARSEYGSFKPDGSVLDASFGFTAEKGQELEIRFSAGNIAQVDQLLIEVNGKYLGFAVPTPGRWGMEERKIIRTALLKKGPNVVRFSNRYPSINKGIWGVRNVYVASGEKGQEKSSSTPEMFLQKAQQFYHQRVSQPGNLWRAQKNIEQAVEAWTIQGIKVPAQVKGLQQAVAKGLDDLTFEKLAQARGALSTGDPENAKWVMRSLLSEFVDPQDPRRGDIEQKWWEMNQ